MGGKHIYDKKKDNGERGIIKRTKKWGSKVKIEKERMWKKGEKWSN